MIPEGISDKYEVVKTLQETAATAVMLVRHNQMGDIRVLKSIQSDSPDAARILSEANLMSGINSPEIPTIYDVGQTKECYYMVEEYVFGKSLNELLLEKQQISVKQIISISLGICKIIEKLHLGYKEPILYLDLKPEHVILSQNQVRLIDFGIAMRKSDAKNGTKYASEKWAPIEQLKGQTLDEGCDIYSIGKIMQALYENCEEKNHRLEKIISLATETNRKNRPDNVSEIIDYLKAFDGNSKEKYKNKHHDKKIAIVKSEEAIGCTLFAVKLTQYLNERKIDCYYKDCAKQNAVNHMYNNLKESKLWNGVLYHKNFHGLMDYGPAVEEYTPPIGSYVYDYGYAKEIPLADVIIFVLGSSPWKEKKELPGWAGDKNVIVCSSFMKGLCTILYAKQLKKPIFKIPVSQNEFSLTKAEKRFYRMITEQIKRINFEKEKKH